MNKIPTIIESLAYLLSKLGALDKIHLVKLMYLADKYHILNYGRTISEDNFFAFQNGPAGSKTMDILEFDSYVLQEYMPLAKKLIETNNENEFNLNTENELSDYEMISITLTTPRSRGVIFNFIEQILQRFPVIQQIIESYLY